MPEKMGLRSVLSMAFFVLITILAFFGLTMAAGSCDSAVNFHADVLSGAAPLTVQFSDDTAVYRSAWNWDFGDGDTDHAQSQSHTYASPGTYTVSLTVIASGSTIGSEVKTAIFT